MRIHDSWFEPLLTAETFTQRMRAIDIARVAQLSPEELSDRVRLADQVRVEVTGGVALLRIVGPIEYKLSFMGWLFGGTSCLAFGAAYRAAIASEDVRAILVEIDSPGGTYPGIPELASEIYKSRGQKPTLAIANVMACSGALWLGSAFERFVSMPSGFVGSLGCIDYSESWSRYLQEAGIDVTIWRSPDGKARPNTYEPMDEATSAFKQANVDRINKEFTAAVASHRGVTAAQASERFGQGRVLSAPQAKAAGLIDATQTWEQASAWIVGKAGRKGARVEDLRRRRLAWEA